MGHRDGALYFPLADGPEARVGNFLHRVLVGRIVEHGLHLVEVFRAGHHIDHASAGAQYPLELFLRKGREAVQQQVGPAGAHRLAEAGGHRVPGGRQCFGGQTHGRLGNVEPGQLQRPARLGKLLRDAAVIPALAAARIQQMQCGTRGGRLAVFQAQFPRRLPEDTVISGVQESAASRHHLFAVSGGFGAHALHRQQMPVALFCTVKAVVPGTFQGHIPGKRRAAQGALPGGKFVQVHTSSLWSSMGAVAPPWAFMYSSKFVNFCCGGRRLMSTRPGSSSFAAG